MNRWTLSKRGEVSGCPRYICSEPPKVAMAAKRNRQTWTIIWLIVSGASDMLRLLWRGGPHPLDHFGLLSLVRVGGPRGPPVIEPGATWRCSGPSVWRAILVHELPLPIHHQCLEVIIRVAAFIARRSVSHLQVDDLFLGFVDQSVAVASARLEPSTHARRQ